MVIKFLVRLYDENYEHFMYPNEVIAYYDCGFSVHLM